MNRLKIIPFALGLGILLATLIGANKLTNGNGDPPAGAGGKAAIAPKATDGLVAKGNVSAEHEPMAFYLPAHLAAGRVAQVFVKNGQTVKPGDPLVRFDDWQYQADLKKAQAAVQVAIRQSQIANGKQEQHKVLVEKAASGHALFDDLFYSDGYRGKVVAIIPDLDKEIRAEQSTAELGTGKFLLPVQSSWLDDFVRECRAFPAGRHDDQVDSLVQFVNWQKMPMLINDPYHICAPPVDSLNQLCWL